MRRNDKEMMRHAHGQMRLFRFGFHYFLDRSERMSEHFLYPIHKGELDLLFDLFWYIFVKVLLVLLWEEDTLYA